MKTQAECWREVLDKKILENEDGEKVHLRNNELFYLEGIGPVNISFDSPEYWHPYTEPKKPKLVNVLAVKDNYGEIRFFDENSEYYKRHISEGYWTRFPSLDQKDVEVE